MAPVMVSKVGGMVMVSACKYLKGSRGRESSLVACGSPGQSWDCCVEALVGRFPPRQQKGLSTGTPLRRESAAASGKQLPVPRGKEGEHFSRMWKRGCVVR